MTDAAVGNCQRALILNPTAVPYRGIVFDITLFDGDIGPLVIDAATIQGVGQIIGDGAFTDMDTWRIPKT